ncbi:hypothetical protein P0F65_06355 [Sphingomonas sp. I4]
MSDPADATIASRPNTISNAMRLALLCLIVFTPRHFATCSTCPLSHRVSRRLRC